MSDIPLVMDIGMYDGSDTAYYLHLGYRVLAVEANPRMIARAQSRFNEKIKSGQLTLLNVAIAPAAGYSKLYVSSQDEGSSTVDRKKLKSRGESETEEVEVRCVPFSSILEEYGTPYYLKIDIEGSDHYCLDAIDSLLPPRYVSWEAGDDALECLIMMHEKGYGRFKLIN